VVWFEPGNKHWHAAAPATAMPHIVFHETLDGKPSNGWNMSAKNNTARERTTEKGTTT
jgi:quercetin dioxygenase-like cupin family protein